METSSKFLIQSKLQAVKPLSKKIHKFPKFIRKPYLKLKSHNIFFVEDSISTCDIHSHIESFSSIEEERTEEIPKFNTLNYTSLSTHRSYTFPCFEEKELQIQIPAEYKQKIVELSCDDDCMTDDEQIKGSIKKLHNSLLDCIQKRSEKKTD